jgi:hypothetical protein
MDYRLFMLSTIYGAVMALEKVLRAIELTPYERQRLDDALFYLEGIYADRKKNIDKRK